MLSLPAWAATFYISPTGNDTNNCTAAQSSSTPKKTFASFFSCGTAGDTYVLLDGTYTQAVTGLINDNPGYGAYSAVPPSGTSTAVVTIVRAQNPGSVIHSGEHILGGATLHDDYITFNGITFYSPNAMAMYVRHGSYITYKLCGFVSYEEDYDSISGFGDSQAGWPSTHHMLLEDCWMWGKARAGTSNYASQYNVFRRVLIRIDGCSTGAACSSQPNVGVTTYASSNISLQNVIVIDRLLGSYDYGDFAQAAHGTIPGEIHRDNEWLGCISLHSADRAAYMDPEASTGTILIKDFVGWDTKGGMIMHGGSAVWTVNNVTINSTSTTGDASATGITLTAMAAGTTLANSIVMGTGGNYGINSDFSTSYMDYLGTWALGAIAGSCSPGCRTTNPLSDGTPASIKYPVRIETGSLLNTAGGSGTYVGAKIIKRYGVDGARHGETNYNTLSSTDLWPWPNEALIKTQMCNASTLTPGGVTRGFCGDTSLTRYVMNYLGNGDPYAGGGVSVNTKASGISSIGGSVTIH